MSISKKSQAVHDVVNQFQMQDDNQNDHSETMDANKQDQALIQNELPQNSQVDE